MFNYQMAFFISYFFFLLLSFKSSSDIKELQEFNNTYLVSHSSPFFEFIFLAFVHDDKKKPYSEYLGLDFICLTI